MFRLDPRMFFNLDPKWDVIFSTKGPYQDLRPGPMEQRLPQLDPNASVTLSAIRDAVDLTYTVGSQGKWVVLPFLATFFFVNLSTSMFTIVVWWANSFAIAFFGIMYHDFSRIEEGAFQTRKVIDLALNPPQDHGDQATFMTLQLNNVRNAIEQIDRMNENVKVLSYISWPMRNVKGNLEQIRDHIDQQLTPKRI